MSTVLYRFLLRGGLAAKVAAKNEIVKDREFEIETDTGQGKRGNGVDHYNDLPYWVAGLGAIDFSTRADGYAVVWDNAAGRYTHAPVSGGGGGSTLIASATLGVAGTTLTIATSSFNLSASKRLRVIVKGKNNTGSDAGYVKLYLNTDTTDANYYSQILVGAGSGATAANANNPSFVYQYASACFEVEAALSLDIDGKCRVTTRGVAGSGSGITSSANAIHYQTAANITGLSVVAPANMAIGSTVEVWTW